jgi:hypothetical protein
MFARGNPTTGPEEAVVMAWMAALMWSGRLGHATTWARSGGISAAFSAFLAAR